MKERLQKFLSRAGVASRRSSEELIQTGKVEVNGRKAKLGDKIDPDLDKIVIAGKTVSKQDASIYLAFNKPKNCVCSRAVQRGKKTIYDFLPQEYKKKVWPVGRLDYASEGLLILTNDGELTQKLTHPRFEHEKEYEVVTNKPPGRLQLKKLSRGVKIGDYKTQPCKIFAKDEKVYITIREGKYRQIRRMFPVVGLEVLSLKRIRIGEFDLPKNLLPGEFVKVPKSYLE